MANRKRKGGGWGGMINKRRNNYAKDTKGMEREFIKTDRVNVPAMILARKYTEKSLQEVTVVVGYVHPGCIGLKATEYCRLLETEDETPMLRIKPLYSYKTEKAFEGRKKYLEGKFPITEEDNFDLIPGRIYKLYCKKTHVPEKNFAIVNMIDFTVSCEVGEPWGGVATEPAPGSSDDDHFEKSFFVRIASMDVQAEPQGGSLLQMLYSAGAITRSVVPYSKRKEEITSKKDAAEAFSNGNMSAGAEIMNREWKRHTWQNRFMPEHGPFILQLGSPPYFLGKYFQQYASGCDDQGRLFSFSPLGPGSSVHDDDVMQFKTRTSKDDETPIHAWRFIAYVAQTTVTDEARDKPEEELEEADLSEIIEHTFKVTMFKDVCITLGTPLDMDNHENIIAVYYSYFPFAISCKVDPIGCVKRPENANDGSAYSVKVSELVGPVRGFWETIGIPITPAMAIQIEQQFPRGYYASKESMPSGSNGIYCISDIKGLGTAKASISTISENPSSNSLFAVICKNKIDGILPYQYKALREFDVWNPDDARQGDLVMEALFFNLEEEIDENSPKAGKLLETLEYFDDEKWEHKAGNFLRPYVYSTDKPEPLTDMERKYITAFLGADQ